MRIDSPGGPPAGLEEFNETIRSLTKPIIGFSDGMVASGAMWVASALDGLIVTKTAHVGSIGVIAVVMEFSKMMENDGVKATLIRSGKLKAIGGRFEPLTEEAEDAIQEVVDHLHGVFVDTVSDGLGMSVDEVSKLADGRIFMGRQAVDVGLADSTGLLNDAIEMALNINNGGTTMGDIKTVSELQAEYPEICAQLESEAQKAVELPDVTAAVSAETERVVFLGLAHFGEDVGGKFKKLVGLGVSVDQYIAMKALTPEPIVETDEELKATHLAALAALKVDVVETGTTEGPKTFEAAWKSIKAEKGCSTREAMSLAAKEYPELHEAQKTAVGGAK